MPNVEKMRQGVTHLGRNPKSVDDAIDIIKRLALESKERARTVYRLEMNDYMARFEVGRVFLRAEALVGNGHKDKYGADLAGRIAQKAGVSLTMLKDCRAVARRAGTLEDFRKRIKEWESQNVRITWNLIKTWGWARLPGTKEEAEVAIETRVVSVERRLRAVASDLCDLKDQVERWQPERRDELLGLAQAVVEAIEDVEVAKREGLRLEQSTRIRHVAYLDYVRGLDCANCGAGGSEPHHVEPDDDRWAIPVCRLCAGQIREVGSVAFWNGYNVWEIVSRTLSNFIEQRYDL
jgi:hypothetical protein